MNDISIELDFKPDNYNLLKCLEYNGYFLSQFLYDKLGDGVNCCISTQNDRNYIIQLTDFWEKKNINASHFINTFEYYQKNVDSAYRLFLPFVGKKNGKWDINMINSNTIEINLLFPFKEFKDMLQSRYIVPSDSAFPIASGRYIISSCTEESIVLESKFQDSKLNVYFNADYERTSIYCANNIIDVTCPMNCSPKIKNTEGYVYKNERGSLVYYLYCKNPSLVKCLETCKERFDKYLCENISKDFYPINSFYIDDECKVKYNERGNNNELKRYKENLFICYSDYYPNEEMAMIWQEVCAEIGIEVKLVKIDSFADYLKERKKYDMYIGVTFPQYDNMHSISMSLIGTLGPRERYEYAKYLYLNDKRELYKYMQTVNGYIPLAISNFSYYRKRNTNFNISEYGYITI